MIRRHGKLLDVSTFKQPVLSDLQGHIRQVADMAAYLAAHEQAVAQSSCYICGSPASRPVATIHGVDYVECESCTHVYTSRRYSEEAIARFYARNDYYARITYANRDTCFYRREHVARPKFAFLEEVSGLARGRWLDVGSGAGDLVSVAADAGWTALGLELSGTSVAFARETFGVELLPETLDDFAKDSARLGTFDVVSFMGVLEHGVDPLRELRHASDLLTTAGAVLIQVPNGRSLSSFIQTVFPEHVFRHMSPLSHVMLFTERSLVEALRRTGFEPLAMWFLGLDVYELANTLTTINPRVQGSALQRTLLERFNELQQAVDRLELGDGLICVARKAAEWRSGV